MGLHSNFITVKVGTGAKIVGGASKEGHYCPQDELLRFA